MPNLRRNRISRTWLLILALAILAFVLGFAGFYKHLAAQGKPRTIADVLYLTLQLFTLESGAVDGKVNIQLQLGRYLAALVSIYAVLGVLLQLFSVELRRVAIRCFGGHIIICGLGRKGIWLVEQLRERRFRVIVIESDANNPDLQHCRDMGAVVQIGSSDDEWTLQRALVHRADTMISVVGDDGCNIETAVRAHALNARRRGGWLRCVIHVSDPDLARMLKSHALFGEQHDPFELELFNSFEVCARVMLREPPLIADGQAASGAGPHIVVVGMGRLGEALTARAIRDWRIDRGASEARLRVSVIDIEASSKEKRFTGRNRDLSDAADVRFFAADVKAPTFLDGLPIDGGDVTAAYVCMDNDSLAAFAALSLQRAWGEGAPVIVRVSEETGLATLLGTDREPGVLKGIRAVGILDVGCRLDSVLGGTVEILAQAIHQGYVQDQTAEGHTAADNPSMAPWHALPESLKQSNRDQALCISEKLAAIGCESVSTFSWPIVLFQFSPAEVEKLAEMEHERFVRERDAAGWTLGETRDVERRISPYLIPWRDLADEIRQYDRNAVLRLPAVLAKADIEIRRKASQQ